MKSFYDLTGEWWGVSTILPSDYAHLELVDRLCPSGKKLILELGAGCGGMAAAAADSGHDVIAVEVSPVRAGYAKALARRARKGRFTLLEADFLNVQLPGRFDIVCYWNGFGIGSDATQRQLLRRIATEWLAPDGCVLMDVFSAWWWSRRAGTKDHKLPNFVQRYDFDPLRCRFIDTWHRLNRESEAITESIRCYTPADLLLLLEPTGLKLEYAEVNGQQLDLTTDNCSITHPLWESWKYLVKLARVGT
jgi:SAM-dependent methyltransferase